MSHVKNEIVAAIKMVCQEKNLSYESVVEALDVAMAAAYRKEYGRPDQNIKARFYPETGAIDVWDEKVVVDDSLKPTDEEMAALLSGTPRHRETVFTENVIDPATGAILPPLKKFNLKTDILFSDAVIKKPDTYVGDTIITPLKPPTDFGRLAATTAKQVVLQKLREAERNYVIGEFKDKEDTIVSAVVQRIEPRGVVVDVNGAQALMPFDEQIRKETYTPGEKIKVYVVQVGGSPRGPEVIVSRAHPYFVRTLFKNEVPEIASGLVEIKAISREAGFRTKVAVAAKTPDIDPVGACVGQRGSRVQVIISELADEKIDIVAWNEDPTTYIKAALAPAQVLEIKFHEDGIHKAKVIVPHDQLSLAIGRGGQNVRLASRLTGWSLDISSPEGVVDREAINESTNKPLVSEVASDTLTE